MAILIKVGERSCAGLKADSLQNWLGKEKWQKCAYPKNTIGGVRSPLEKLPSAIEDTGSVT
jgi:hypothetical protein